MLIMPTTDVNFQALADNITSDFFSKGTPLADGIVKTAKEHSFTPEEVKRLVEKTNTSASLHLLKTADDKKATFTLAHLDLVLQQTHPSEQPQEKTAAYKGIPKTRYARPIEKTAAVVEPQEQTINSMRALFTVRQEIDNCKLQKTAEELKVKDKIDYLASEFSVYNGPDFNKYATDCDILFGNRAKPVLDKLSDYLRAPIKKVACETYYIDDRSPHIKAMGEICSGLENIIKLGHQITRLENVQKVINAGLNYASRTGQ